MGLALTLSVKELKDYIVKEDLFAFCDNPTTKHLIDNTSRKRPRPTSNEKDDGGSYDQNDQDDAISIDGAKYESQSYLQGVH